MTKDLEYAMALGLDNELLNKLENVAKEAGVVTNETMTKGLMRFVALYLMYGARNKSSVMLIDFSEWMIENFEQIVAEVTITTLMEKANGK